MLPGMQSCISEIMHTLKTDGYQVAENTVVNLSIDMK